MDLDGVESLASALAEVLKRSGGIVSARRVIHAVSSLNIGGAERLVVDLAAVQKRRGLEPIILNFGHRADPLCIEAESLGIEVRCLADIVGSVRRTRALLAILRERPPAILHIHSPWCLPRLALALPLHCGTSVYTRHGAHAYASMYWKMMHWWCHLFIDHLTFVSPQSRDVHRRTYGSTSPHHVIEFGVDIPQAPVGASASPSVQIGCVGRLVEVKGQRSILGALSHLESQIGWQMHFYGDGPDRAALESTANTITDGKVTFHGTVMDRNEIYRDMAILVVASRMEGRSLAIMEAMARGIPVVATAVGGNPEMVQHGRGGLLVPYGDVAELARTIGKLLNDRDLRLSLGHEARRIACKSFSLDHSAEQLDLLYWQDVPVR